MSVVAPRAYGMLGTAAEWLSQLDRTTLCCDNVGVGCIVPRFVKPVTMGRSIITARFVNAFHCSQARSIDTTKGLA
jgi:hypothetical protein